MATAVLGHGQVALESEPGAWSLGLQRYLAMAPSDTWPWPGPTAAIVPWPVASHVKNELIGAGPM